MRLRHKKWTDRVLNENVDIANDLDTLDINKIKKAKCLEIGCGQAGFLLDMSKNKPKEFFLGVEINRNAFAMAVKHASLVKNEINNFYILNSPIEKLFEIFKNEQFSNIYINFPDPWPRKKEHKKRLTYITRLNEYYKFLKKGGQIFFRSDNVDLFNDSLKYFQESNFSLVEVVSPFYYERHNILSTTEYETKFRNNNININLIVGYKE